MMAPPERMTGNGDTVEISEGVYSQIETPNWAPWLRASIEQIAGRISAFEEGHIFIKEDDDEMVGFLSSNRIEWDGNPDTLPTWDSVAGRESDFSDTYQANGNTICLMSMGIAGTFKGLSIPEQLVREIQRVARELGAEHIIGDFRPSGFGQHKHSTGDVDFASYVKMQRGDNQPLDPWIRNVTRLGMKPLKIDLRAMVVRTSIEELKKYMSSYKPESWYPVEDPEMKRALIEQHQPHLDIHNVDHVIECEETGTWYLDETSGQAVYIESNYWGELPVLEEAA